MLLDPDLLRLFFPAAIILVLVPGPDTLLVLSSSLGGGRRAGLMATGGILSGNLVHAGAAALGISALLAASPILFDILRWAGTAYLAWLGVKALRAARDAVPAPLVASEPAEGRRIFRNAVLTNLLNPKLILFNLAFVPQFVSPGLGHVGGQSFLLCLFVGGMGACYMVALAVVGAKAGQRLFASRRVQRAMDVVTGIVFLGFAVRLWLSARQG